VLGKPLSGLYELQTSLTTKQGEYVAHMEKRLLFQQSTPRYTLPTAVFTLPGILPADRRLLLDPEMHTAILLSLEGSDAVPIFSSFQLTPSATTIFLTLLQAYPQYCSYQSLFRSLYPSTLARDEGECVWEKDLAVPSVRRALKALLPALRSLGLQVISLRSQGYVLAALTDPRALREQERIEAEQQREREDA
jgi:hypothetical protein